ncbi:hypothetical protein [Kitasatospora cinereorecta]|uniref:Glycerophosphoryl diester phosphodiesterase membrane domain-containing protein n=1 Tax=Kitasatospora cinereorecta TaxID=285560 RepID=A0ABW0VBF0_9ACTN
MPLRPLTFGDVISGVFATLRRYAAPLYLPLLVVVGVSVAVVIGIAVTANAVLGDLYRSVQDDSFYEPTSGEVASLISVVSIGSLLLIACFTAMSVVSSTTATVVMRHAVIGRRVTARQVWAESRRWLWRVLGSYLLLGAGLLGAVLVVGVLSALVGLLTRSAGVGVVAIPLMMVIYGVAIYAAVRLALLVPVLVLEESGVVAAVRRAWKLNEGAWWRSLLIPYVVNMIGSFAAQFVWLPFMFVGMVAVLPTADGDPGDGPSMAFGSLLLLIAVMLIGFLLAMALTMPLAPVTHGLLYVDRRIRRERLDIALGEAAGLWTTAPQAPPTAPEPPAAPEPPSAPEPQDADKPQDAEKPEEAEKATAEPQDAPAAPSTPDLTKREAPKPPEPPVEPQAPASDD